MSSSSVRAAVSPGPAHEQSRPPLTGPELLGVLDDVDDPEHVHRALEGGLGVVSTSRGRVVGGGGGRGGVERRTLRGKCRSRGSARTPRILNLHAAPDTSRPERQV